MKIRVTSDLLVVTSDHRFANSFTWDPTNATRNNPRYKFLDFGVAGDCTSATCDTNKKGKFRMDVRGTGLRFVTPINWLFIGWPSECQGKQPVNYSVNERNQVITGHCGARCGGCRTRNLSLEVDGC